VAASGAVVGSPDRIVLERLQAPDFDPREEVHLGRSPGALDTAARECGAILDPIVAEKDADYRIVLRGQATCPRILVVSESFDPGWRAWVDDEPAEVLRVDHALVGIPIEGPGSRVDLRYEAPGFSLGLSLSGLATLLLSTALAAGGRLRRWLVHPDRPGTTRA
jgi:hypothetical protein